ncbi:hypothetical protein T440DRAFT_548127 [Plenodomus tracheiphilus IPT5]|uniref:ATPase synthesis protein 25 n=1 Tax=Plenodomus tracheiphilus IPT5 TaxID=1408161 RepID=A0A6A7ARB9_9PLEO|nr:hypothetical protein T440DRAFT_548127 [Plenodomus tracheiphilus IPT5]
MHPANIFQCHGAWPGSATCFSYLIAPYLIGTCLVASSSSRPSVGDSLRRHLRVPGAFHGKVQSTGTQHVNTCDGEHSRRQHTAQARFANPIPSRPSPALDMFLSRVASSTFVCRACRQAASSSTRAHGPAHDPLQASTTWSRPRPRRALSTSPCQRTEKHDAAPVQSPEPTLLQDQAEAAASTEGREPLIAPKQPPPAATTPAAPRPSASVPWYLRTQPSVPSPIHPAQIPDLPPNSPPLLETLLEYISVTAGLDHLSLLDLRHLDPPPALGPKLIMIIGTARSEKHLHVAADRFCRYLRRDHGLNANAAGLLGRNELKIKLRRKAKRMRMLANVGGAAPEGNIDDGIRTGWICCTLGKIEAHPEDTKMPGDDVREFIGFRDVKPGVNVVVQMFTEEKRAETDLETLWGGVLRTHQRRDKTADEALQELEQDLEELEREDVEFDDDSPPDLRTQQPTMEQKQSIPLAQSTVSFHRPRPSPGDMFPSASDGGPPKQLRKLDSKA